MAPSAHAPLREGLGTLAHAEGGQPSLQLLQLCQQPLSEHRDQQGCTSLRLSPLGVVTPSLEVGHHHMSRAKPQDNIPSFCLLFES